jgi:bifunctional DNase/RNase
MIEVTVKNILFFSKASSPGYTLFLQAVGDADRGLPIVVGQFEAQAIALALEQIRMDRPMTHDLLSATISQLTDGLDSVSITDLKEGTFYARLYIRQAGAIEILDARPSDAIALALRAQVPIRVAAAVFKEASVRTPRSEKEDQSSEPSLAENVEKIIRQAELRSNLEKDLREAVSREDYESAARIRDRILMLSDDEHAV